VVVSFPTFRPGSFVLHLTLRDVYTGRTGTAALPFSIMPRP
jgi:hypothetical protein